MGFSAPRSVMGTSGFTRGRFPRSGRLAVRQPSLTIRCVLASPIDPRDQTSEIDDPAYRAYFWDSPQACDEWELTEADLDEVLSWVQANSRGRPHSLWAVVRRDQDVELIRLRGIDPTADPGTWPIWAEETRV